MDLTRMTRGELAGLQAQLASIGRAAEVLAAATLEPTICLTPRETVIRCAPLYDEPDSAVPDVLVEVDVSPPPFAILQTASGAHDEGLRDMCGSYDPLPQTESPPLPTVPAAAQVSSSPLSQAETADIPARRTGTAGRDAGAVVARVRGPITIAERARIMEMHEAGKPLADIAAALNRPVPPIAGFVTQLTRKAVPKSAAFQPIGDVAARVVKSIPAGQPAPAAQVAADKSGEGAAIPVPEGEGPECQQAKASPGAAGGADVADNPVPVAGGAGPGMPGGDGEGLQQHPLAEHDPLQTGAGSGIAPDPAPVEAPSKRREPPPELTGEARRIWQALEWVGYTPPFDAEADLDLAMAFARGSKLGRVAEEFELDAQIVKRRYEAITECIRNKRGDLLIDGQTTLLRVLRVRMVAARSKAA